MPSFEESPFTVIESPFTAPTTDGLVRNVQYAMLAVRDSLARGEAPLRLTLVLYANA